MQGDAALSVTVVSPNGGELWVYDAVYSILWTTSGGSGTVTVDIELSVSGASGPWTSLVSGKADDGLYSWRVNSSASDNCYIRVTAHSGSETAHDDSDSAFSISVPALHVTIVSPNGGEKLVAGTIHNVIWNSPDAGPDATATISYSTSGASGPWNAVASSIPNNGSYAWLVPDTPSSNCRIRVNVTETSPPHRTGEAVSASDFEIAAGGTPAVPIVVLKKPDGGETLTIGSTYDIEWYAHGGSGNITVSLYYSVLGTGGPWTIIATNMANTGKYGWFVPNSPTTNAYVRITANDESTPPLSSTDTSNSSFIISTGSNGKPSVTVVSPNGGESWTAGTSHDIEWSASGGTGTLTITIEYSTSGKNGPWMKTASGESNDGVLIWTVPNTPSSNCYVRITAEDSASPPASASDVSDMPFTITADTFVPSVNVISPNGGEVLVSGDLFSIRWTASGGTEPLTIKIEYSLNGLSPVQWTVIASELANNGTYVWLVPSVSSGNCYVRVTATDNSTPPKSTTDISDDSFAINQGAHLNPKITLNSPNGGESWQGGTFNDIKWYAYDGTGNLTVDIEYSTTGVSGPWKTIAAGLTNTGTYTWYVPNEESNNCYIRVAVEDESVPAKTANDISDQSFTITKATTGMILGTVKDSAGSPLKDTAITVKRKSDGVTVKSIDTDADGKYAFIILPGNYTIQASHIGYVPSDLIDICVIAGRQLVQNFTLLLPSGHNNNSSGDGWLEKNLPLIVGMLIVVLVAVVAVAILLNKKKRKTQESPLKSPQKSETINQFSHQHPTNLTGDPISSDYAQVGDERQHYGQSPPSPPQS